MALLLSLLAAVATVAGTTRINVPGVTTHYTIATAAASVFWLQLLCSIGCFGGTKVRGYEISLHASFQRKVYSRTPVPPYLRTSELSVPPNLDSLIIHGNFVEQRKLFF